MSLDPNVILPIASMIIVILPMVLDIIRLRSDVPRKRLEGLSKSFDLLEKENDFLRVREAHYLEYIDYLWVWIRKYKPKRIKAPKGLEVFIMRNKR